MLPLALLAVALAADPKAPDTNVVIRGATIHDGSGGKPVVGDVHIQGDRIAAVGQVGKIDGAKEITGQGLVVCPGFIDLHTHCDFGLFGPVGKQIKNYVTQGCTTLVSGNCGSGPVEVGGRLKLLDEGGIGPNVAHLVPHNAVRYKVMKNVNRKPSEAEQKAMEELVDKAMADGAWGLSTGLIYTPGTYSETAEIVGLAKAAGKHGGLYASHIRDEGSGLLVAIEEALKIGRESGCPVHISHIKVDTKAVHGSSVRAVEVIESARKKGQTITADQYPYTAASTALQAIVVPSRYREGTAKEYVARLDDPTVGPKIREAVEKALKEQDDGKQIRISQYAKNPKWQGKSIAAIAEAEQKTPVEVVLEIERNGGAGIVDFCMSEEDVRVYMKRPWVATASDAGPIIPDNSVPHPRAYGTFPRKVGRYAIDDRIVPLEQAIRSCTGLPADILKLPERGYLKAGHFADVVVFDPVAFRDTATYEKPHQYAAGLKWVFVNGVAAVADGEHQPTALAGRTLRHRN